MSGEKFGRIVGVLLLGALTVVLLSCMAWLVVAILTQTGRML